MERRVRPRRAASLRSRVLVLELDSIRQADRFADADSVEDAVTELTGVIRTALLLTDRISVTDSMLFDGTYFAHMPPDALAQALGVHASALPIEIIASHDTLAASLRNKRDAVGFEWQSGKHLTRDRMARHHEAWVAMEGRISLSRYGAMPDLLPPDPDWLESLTPTAVSLVERIRGERRRSLALAAIAEAQQSSPHDNAVANVRRWWLNGYNMAIATAVDADWLRFDAIDDADDGLQRASAAGRRRIAVSPKIVEIATEVPAPVFGTVRAATAPHRGRLRRAASWWTMRNLTYALTTATKGSSLLGAITDAVTRVGIAAFAIAMAVPGASEQVTGWGLAWLVFGISALSTVPYGAIGLLFTVLRRDRVPLLSFRIDTT